MSADNRRQGLPSPTWALVGAMVLAIAGCTRPMETTEPVVEQPMEKPKAEPVGEPIPDTGQTAARLEEQRRAELACARVTVAAAGDIMLGTDYPENRLAPEAESESMLADVTPVFSSADISFGNLEGVLMDGGEPAKTCKNPSACYLFRSPARYVGLLADAGFTVMSLANNHSRDFGEEGRTATMTALDSVGIRHSGRIGDIATWPNGQIRTALIAFAPFANSYPMLDLDVARSEVASLAELYDIVIVSVHGGAEGNDASNLPFANETYYGEDRGDVVKFSRAMIDAGADLVIGHGPHVPRAIEIHDGRLVAYSLGNFATYYGISIDGDKGLAPILVATLDGNGRFINGEIVSSIQARPGGPRLDASHRAYERIWELTEHDFSGGGIRFQNGGSFFPVDEPRDECQRHPGQAGQPAR